MVRSVTLRIRRSGARGAGGVTGASGSSSNGRSNRFAMGRAGELGQLVQAVAQSLDVGRATGPIVGLYDDGIQTRVARGRLELGRHAVQKASKCRLDLDTNHRVVWSGHPHIREVR